MLFAQTTYECDNITFAYNDKVKVTLYECCMGGNPYDDELEYVGTLSSVESDKFNLFTDKFCITIQVDDVEQMIKI